MGENAQSIPCESSKPVGTTEDTELNLPTYRLTARYKIEPSACAYCAKCHSICPTYLPTRDEGYSARGKILLWSALKGEFDHIRTGRLTTSDEVLKSKRLLDYLNFCTRCYRCLDVCPASMATVPIFEQMRFSLASKYPPPFPLRLIMRYVMPNRSIMRLISNLAEIPFSLLPLLANRISVPDRFRRWLLSLPKYETLFFSLTSGSPSVTVMGKSIAVPASALRRAQAFQFATHLKVKGYLGSVNNYDVRMVALFPDCLSDVYFPGLFYSTAKVLRSLGYDLVIPASVSCCGASALNTGDKIAFVKMAKNVALQMKELAEQRGKKPEALIFTNPTCFKTVKERYPDVLHHRELTTIPTPRLDIDFILPMLATSKDSFQVEKLKEIKFAWHNPCNLGYALGVQAKTITILLKEIGLNITHYPATEGCCGFGGMFHLRFPKEAEKMSEQKFSVWKEEDVDVVLTCSAGCITHLNSVAMKLNRRYRRARSEKPFPPAVHYLELLSALIRSD